MSFGIIGKPINAVLGSSISGFERGFDIAETRLSSFASKAKSVSTKMMRIGKTLFMRLTAPIAAGTAFAVKQFGSFDQAMIESTSIMGNLSEKTKRSMRSLAKEMSLKGNTGPEKLARGYFYLASAGMDAEQSMAALKPVMQFGIAGAFDLATATDLATDAQSALGLSSKDAAENQRGLIRVTDVLVKANTLANASVQGFSESLTNKAAASLKILNKDVEEGVAILAAMADQGVKGQTAGERFSIFVRYLQQAVLQNSEAFKKFGITVYDSMGNVRSFVDILKDFETAMGNASPEQMSKMLDEMGITARSQDVFKMLVGTSGKIAEYEKKLRSAGGTTKDVADKQMKSFWNQLRNIWNYVKVVGIEIGDALAPSILKLGNKVRNAVVWFRSLSDGTKKWMGIVVAAAAAVGPLLIGLGAIAASISYIATVAVGAIGAIGSIIGALSVPVLVGIAVATTGIVVAMNAFGVSLSDVGKFAKDSFSSLVKWITKAWTISVGFITNFKTNMQILGKWFSSNWKSMFSDIGSIALTFLKNMAHNSVVVMQDIALFVGIVHGYIWDNFGDLAVGALKGAFKLFVGFFKGLISLAISAGKAIWKGLISGDGALQGAISLYKKGFKSKGTLKERLASFSWTEGLRSPLEGLKLKTTVPEFKLDTKQLSEVKSAVGKSKDSTAQAVAETKADTVGQAAKTVEETSTEKTAGALEAGSSAAYEAIFKGQNKAADETARNTRSIALQSTQQTKHLNDISSKLDLETVSI